MRVQSQERSGEFPLKKTIEEAVIQKLAGLNATLCTVESCTGGLVASLLTDVPGASEVFWGSFVTYDNSAKLDLGVSKSTLKSGGAVSEKAARELAESGLARLRSALTQFEEKTHKPSKTLLCLATTGIAGPSGGSIEKPVGLCYIGLATTNEKTLVLKFQAENVTSRTDVKAQFASKALELILKCM